MKTIRKGGYKIVILNMKKDGIPSKTYDFKVDRGSALGNPYREEKYGRMKCIEKYEEFLDRMVTKKGKRKNAIDKMVKVLKKYKKIRLFCWCTPLPCHGVIIGHKVLEQLRMEK